MSDMNTTESTTGSKASIERQLLGEKLRFVRDEAGKKAIVVAASTPTSVVVAQMRDHSSGGVLVTGEKDAETLVGIFTTRDYLDKLAGCPSEELDKPITSYMTSTPKTLSPEHTVGDAIQVMTVGGYRHVPLLDEKDKLSGLVSVRDIIHFISDHFPEEVYNHPPVLNQPIETQEGG